jgi:hypothetical protein
VNGTFRFELGEALRTHGCALILSSCGALGPEAQRRMLEYRKEHGELPPHDWLFVDRDSAAFVASVVTEQDRRLAEDAVVAEVVTTGIPEPIRDEFTAMVVEMRDADTKPCGCGYPEKPCLRVMFRNGPPFPARPCEPA